MFVLMIVFIVLGIIGSLWSVTDYMRHRGYVDYFLWFLDTTIIGSFLAFVWYVIYAGVVFHEYLIWHELQHATGVL